MVVRSFVGCRFALAVVGGRLAFVSVRSGRVLSGAAVRACAGALRRRGLGLFCSGVFGAGSSVRFPGVLAAPVRPSVSFVGASSGSVLGFGGLFALGFVPCLSSRVRSLVAEVRRRARSGFRFGGCLPSGGCPPSASPASFSGSVLLLSSPAFASAVAGGACPVALASASFPRWCLRSGLVGALCLAGRAGALRAGVSRAGLAPVLRSFLSVALPSLGVSSSLSSPALWPSLVSVWSVGVPPRPAWASRRGVRWGLFGVAAAFRRLSSCLSWLLRRGGRCPGAVRPLLACLCGWCLLALRG